MDSPLNYSRLSKADSQKFRSTGTSLVFRTVGRNTKPSWSNRIIKDVNDLTYNVDINLFGKNRLKSVTLENRRQKNNSGDKKAIFSARQKRRSFFSQELNRMIKSIRKVELQQLRRLKQTPKDKNTKKIHGQVQTYGLSVFQFKDTIKGKLQTKANIHLKFDNQSQRKNVEQSLWYNPQLEIDVGKMDQKKYRRVLDKYHPFQSYTDRKVFQVSGQLDKVYEIEQAKRRTSPNRIKNTVPLETVSGRRDQTIKQSSYLSYQIQDAQLATIQSSPKYSVVRTPKRLLFSRQVISDRRGCYR